MLHLTQNDYAVSRWSGGSTTQIAVFPPDSSYSARNFLWRVSSAVVEDERSTFTPLPDYDRHLMLLDGSLLLRHDGGEPLRLNARQVHSFDGGAATESQGRCRDFNLMLRKGLCRGELRHISFEGTGEELLRLPLPDSKFSHSAFLLYCAAGSVRVSLNDEVCSLTESESLLTEDTGDAALHLMGQEAAFAAAAIWWD